MNAFQSVRFNEYVLRTAPVRVVPVMWVPKLHQSLCASFISTATIIVALAWPIIFKLVQF